VELAALRESLNGVGDGTNGQSGDGSGGEAAVAETDGQSLEKIAGVIRRDPVTQAKLGDVFRLGEHLCMTMRGIRTPSRMTTSVVRGLFKTNHDARSEFLRIIALPASQRVL